MVYCEDKQYKKYNKNMFRIKGSFTAWHALYLMVPFFIVALIPYMYLSAQSSLSISNIESDNIQLVANVETSNTVESFLEPVAMEKSKILFVGDSITAGLTNCDYTIAQCDTVGASAVSKEIDFLGEDGFAAKIDNVQAQTTADHLEKGLNVEGADIAQIMLGTNDAGKGISKEEYKQNMQSIIDSLLGSGVKKVMINKPIFATSIHEAINEYWDYLQAEPSVFDDASVVKGDEDAYDWFAQKTYLLDGDGEGFHPNEFGYEMLGQFWAKALQRAIAENTAKF
jgi:Lysophospholipase L1 and related esterases